MHRTCRRSPSSTQWAICKRTSTVIGLLLILQPRTLDVCSRMATASALSNTYDHEESTQSLLTLRESEYGSRYMSGDDSGVYLTSVAVTVLVSGAATIGILLVTFVITLAVLLASCGDRSDAVVRNVALSPSERCYSFRINAELNNIQDWLVPMECETHVSEYFKTGQYEIDLQGTVDAAKKYLTTLPAKLDGLDVVVMDIDDTALSNLQYLSVNGLGTKKLDLGTWNHWVMESRAPAISAVLVLYKELQAAKWEIIFITERPESQRKHTMMNLFSAGYEGWRSLIMRSEDQANMSVGAYKLSQRLELQKMGYRIHITFGDQWCDVKGPAVGNRSFKVPNPVYYTN